MHKYFDSVINLSDSLGRAGIAGALAGDNFRKSFERLMRDEYKRNVGRLPGSSRTSRLRKKRDKIVSNWYISFDNFDGNTGR